MLKETYRYEFSADLPRAEIEGTLTLALIAVESIHGESQVLLDAEHALDLERGLCVIDASTRTGVDLNKAFTGFLTREFGPDAFRVERVIGIASDQQRAAPKR